MEGEVWSWSLEDWAALVAELWAELFLEGAMAQLAELEPELWQRKDWGAEMEGRKAELTFGRPPSSCSLLTELTVSRFSLDLVWKM